MALSVLNGFGLPWFQGLPAVHFATPAKADENRTPIYSFRLMASLQLGRDWRAVLASAGLVMHFNLPAERHVRGATRWIGGWMRANPASSNHRR